MHSLLKPATFFLTLGIALSAFSQVKVSNRITEAIDDRDTAQLRGTLHPPLQHATDQGRMDGVSFARLFRLGCGRGFGGHVDGTPAEAAVGV